MRSRSHFSLSIVSLVVENIVASSIFAVCFFSLLLLHHFCCCGRTMRQQRYPLLIKRYKQATRPYQPPGLIKSNFLFTGQLRSAVVSSCFHIIFCLPSLNHASPKSRKLSYRILPSSGTILLITYTHHQ